jgi:ubiquinone/menaquinone biosynthesis C-methylase UbiE
MRKSNTLMVLGHVISNPKKFAGEWRQAQQELTNLQQRHSQDKQRLAELERLQSDLRRDLEKDTDRTRHLKAAYERFVSSVQASHSKDEAMSLAVGGSFERTGSIELALLQHFGLRPDSYLIDVGCGSGRLAKPLTTYLFGHYSGFDIVADLVNYARQISGRPDWRFGVVDHIQIPEPDGCADMVCFFSVLTHLLHEQSYWYLEEAIRVLKPGGKIMISFLDFDETAHWPIFIYTLKLSKDSADVPMNVFMSKEMIRTFALHLNLEIERFVGATEEIVQCGVLGQSLCVLRKM